MLRRPWFLVFVLVGCGPSGSASSQAPDSAFDGMGHAPGTEPSPFVAAEDGRGTGPDTPTPTSDRPPRTIYRSELTRATERGPAWLLRQLGPEPFRHHGVFVGWELTALFPDDPHLCGVECDVAVGDVILSVNGSRLETPQQLSDALSELPGADRLEVHSLRGEKRREVVYRIVDDD